MDSLLSSEEIQQRQERVNVASARRSARDELLRRRQVLCDALESLARGPYKDKPSAEESRILRSAAELATALVEVGHAMNQFFGRHRVVEEILDQELRNRKQPSRLGVVAGKRLLALARTGSSAENLAKLVDEAREQLGPWPGDFNDQGLSPVECEPGILSYFREVQYFVESSEWQEPGPWHCLDPEYVLRVSGDASGMPTEADGVVPLMGFLSDAALRKLLAASPRGCAEGGSQAGNPAKADVVPPREPPPEACIAAAHKVIPAGGPDEQAGAQERLPWEEQTDGILVHGLKQILKLLELPSDRTNQRRIKKYNRLSNGPIRKLRGGRVWFADHGMLLAWRKGMLKYLADREDGSKDLRDARGRPIGPARFFADGPTGTTNEE